MDNCFISAIACFTICFIARVYYPFIMTTNYIFHIIHATIANSDIVAIEDLVIFMISTKMFI